MFSQWEVWQIALTAVFGSVWLVFFALDIRRRIAANKRKKQIIQELRRDGYSDELIHEMLQQRRFNK